MGLKKRSKVNAEFSMSSLTDIIFLLLIFFMLTANFVRVDNFELPKSDSKTVAPMSMTVSIEKSGKFTLNGNDIGISSLKKALQLELRKAENRQNATVAIVAEVGVPFERVQAVMNVVAGLNAKAILATQARTKNK
jgi:biopolymer transport protein ExbD